MTTRDWLLVGLLTFLAVPDLAAGLQDDELTNVAQSEAWLNLLYYERTGSGFVSRVNKPEFFATREAGFKDPLGELRAELAAFRDQAGKLDVTDPDSSAQCLFPARYRFLRTRLSLPAPAHCPKLETWKGSYKPNGIKLVYASQYISNPASVFGHSFVVATNNAKSKGFWLTYNFAADMPQGLEAYSYVVGGLTGWYRGDYSVLPFYQRLFQYGAVENRDLWLYQLKLTPDELDLFLSHMWELVHAAKFTYYFLDENCAGILLRAFAAVLPDLSSARRLPIYAHPVDVIRALDRAGRLGPAEVIPSEGNVLSESVWSLTRSQRRRFMVAIDNPDAPLDDESVDSAVAESLIHYTSFRTQRNKGDIPEELKNLERNSLVRRSQFPAGAAKVATAEQLAKSPHLSHQAMAVQAGASVVRGQAAVDLGFRFAIHDVLDRNEGFLENSTIEVMNVQLSAAANTVWIKDITVARVENFRPLNFYDPSGSWRIKVALKANDWTDAQTDVYGLVSGGYGASLPIGRALAFGMLGVDANFGGELPQGRLQVGPELGVVWQGRWIRTMGALGVGVDALDGFGNPFARARAGAGWSVGPDWTVLHGAELQRLVSPREREVLRFDVALRRYF